MQIKTHVIMDIFLLLFRYPDRMAWQLNLTRKDIRREEAYFKLHNFLISGTQFDNKRKINTIIKKSFKNDLLLTTTF